MKHEEEKKILRNRARCLICGDLLESTDPHDFQMCTCGNLFVDGGTEYIRRGAKQGESSFEDLNEFEEELDITGTPLTPGDPERCLGNGKHAGYPLCCDECDHFLRCYPECVPGNQEKRTQG